MALILLASCDGCGCGAPGGAGDETSYLRCVVLPPLDDQAVGSARVADGLLHLELEEDRPLRLAAFRGPGPFVEAIDAALAAVSEGEPDVVLVLGGIGDTVEIARRNGASLGALGVPTLLVSGGRDDEESVEAAIEAGGSTLLDARRLRGALLADVPFVFIAGARAGRYARTDSVCGFELEDLTDLRAPTPADPSLERKPVLVSWQAPTGVVVDDVEVGDDALGDLRDRLDVQASIFAWPGAERRPKRYPLRRLATDTHAEREPLHTEFELRGGWLTEVSAAPPEDAP